MSGEALSCSHHYINTELGFRLAVIFVTNRSSTTLMPHVRSHCTSSLHEPCENSFTVPGLQLTSGPEAL